MHGDDDALAVALVLHHQGTKARRGGGTRSVCVPCRGWDATPGYVNTITFTLEPTDDTDPDLDRLAWIWAIKVEYTDTSGEVFWKYDYLDMNLGPTFSTSSGVGAAAIAQTNGQWRVAPWLDGVTVNHDISEASFNPDAFDWMMAHTCDWMHNLDPARRCLVDERISLNGLNSSGESAYDRGLFVLPDMEDRMTSGDAHGDGVLATTPAMEIENLGVDGGRFGVKEPLDSTSYDLMFYEPRLAISWPSEVHEFSTTLSRITSSSPGGRSRAVAPRPSARATSSSASSPPPPALSARGTPRPTGHTITTSWNPRSRTSTTA